MELQFCWFSGEQGIEGCKALRREVFIREQGISEQDEEDGCDEQALHLAALEGGRVIGTARLLPQNWVLGRVAVAADRRRQGVGRLLMREALRKAFASGAPFIRVHAQERAVPFYTSLGFTPEGKPFYEAGILHLAMRFDAPEARR